MLVQEVAASLNLVLLTNRTLLTRAEAAAGLGLETYLCVIMYKCLVFIKLIFVQGYCKGSFL